MGEISFSFRHITQSSYVKWTVKGSTAFHFSISQLDVLFTFFSSPRKQTSTKSISINFRLLSDPQLQQSPSSLRVCLIIYSVDPAESDLKFQLDKKNPKMSFAAFQFEIYFLFIPGPEVRARS